MATGGPLSAGADLGRVYGEATRCPACGAFATVLSHPELRWVCGVCGAPRIQMPEGHDLPEESAVAIREAAGAQRAAALGRLTTWALGAPAAIIFVLAIVLSPMSFLAGGVLVAAGIVLSVLSSRASRRAAAERKRVREAADRAYEAAVAVLGQGKTPAEIAAALHISEADAETMITMVSARAQVRVAVDPLAAAVTEPEPEPEHEAEPEAAPGLATRAKETP